MVFVLDTLPPTPSAVGAHEQNFAGAKCSGRQQRQSTVLVGHLAVDRQDFAARFRADHRGVPLEAGQVFPDLNVLGLRVGEFREQAGATSFGQFKMARRARAPSARLSFVENDRAEFGKFRPQQAELSSLPTGHEDQTAGLLFDQASEQLALFFGQLVIVQTDIPQKDHVELRQVLNRFGKDFDVVLGSAAHFFQPGMKQQAGNVDAWIS